MCIVVTDATRLERNLNLVLQVLEITDRVVVCLNLIDEAKRHGLDIDERRLARDLGVPVVPTIARKSQGLDVLLEEVNNIATGKTICKPYRIEHESPQLRDAIQKLSEDILNIYPDLPNVHWVATRLLDGDEQIAEAFLNGEIGHLESAIAEDEEMQTLDKEIEVVK